MLTQVHALSRRRVFHLPLTRLPSQSPMALAVCGGTQIALKVHIIRRAHPFHFCVLQRLLSSHSAPIMTQHDKPEILLLGFKCSKPSKSIPAGGIVY